MTTTHGDERLPTAARAAAISALRTVCGIEDVHVTATGGPGAGTRETTYTADFTGWSPSLHRIRCYAHVNADHRDSDFAQVLADAFAATLGSQRRRLEAGIALGIVSPLPMLIDSADEIETGHLLVDRDIKELVAHHGQDAYSELLEVLMAMHGGDNDHDGSDVLEGDGGILAETPEGRVVGLSVSVGRTSTGEDILFDGLVLEIPDAALPQTAMTGLVGRPLRILTPVHPLLDDREIVAIEHGTQGDRPSVRVALALDLVPFDSIA